MSAMNAAFDMQNLQVFADRDLRSMELPGEIDDQHAPVAMQ
jgi:hypothetical protein